MKTRFTTLLSTVLFLLLAGQAAAQDPMIVTVRDINAIDQANIQTLNDAGAGLAAGDIGDLIFNSLVDSTVQFTAVVMTDPLTSGLASVNNDRPDRIHVFVRDTTANSMGPAGMGVQLVDGSFDTTGLLDVTIGDVVTIVGTVGPFGTTMQVAPTTVTLLGRFDTDFGLPASFMDPVEVTTADLNMMIDTNGGVQVNWNNLADMRGQFVHVSSATVQVRDISTDRPNWLFSTDGGDTVVNFYDTSLRYRNDRDGVYPAGWNTRTDDFVPPVPGSLIDIQGFITNNGDDPFVRGVPGGALLSFNPFEDSDLTILESPPQVSTPSKPDFVPTSSDDIAITADATPDPMRTITGAVLKYTTSDNATEQEITGTSSDGVTFDFTIPAQADGVFVTYFMVATDNTGAMSETDPVVYRVLDAGINEISDIQATSDGGPGDSPYRNLTTDMDITATIQSVITTSSSQIVSAQDDAGLGAWTGIVLDTPDVLNPGDQINITNATVEENFGLTRLTNLTYTMVGSGDPLGYLTVTTDALQDSGVAEGFEGMLLHFDDVVVTETSADAPSDFGEFSFSSDGTTDNQVRSDDSSTLVDGGTTLFNGGERLDFLQGLWYYSFSNYKLEPQDPATDIGMVTNVATEDDVLPGSFGLHQNFPNPFGEATTIRYELAKAGHVTLEVFDLLGRRVASLVNGEQAVGTHAATFESRDLAGGMYFYRLAAGSKVVTKTMTLVR